MQVVLLERIESLGAMGEVVTVRPGYARNYLLPQKKALRATEANIQRFEREREALEKLNEERRSDAASEGDKLEGKTFVLIRQAGDTGQLYGSVTSRDIAEAAAGETGVDVSRGQVRLDQPIKTIGVYDITVRLHPEVHVNIQVNVARSQDEADRQAKGEDIIATAREEDRAAALAERTGLSEEDAMRLFEEGVEPDLAEPAGAETEEGEPAEGEAAEDEGETAEASDENEDETTSGQ